MCFCCWFVIPASCAVQVCCSAQLVLASSELFQLMPPVAGMDLIAINLFMIELPPTPPGPHPEKNTLSACNMFQVETGELGWRKHSSPLSPIHAEMQTQHLSHLKCSCTLRLRSASLLRCICIVPPPCETVRLCVQVTNCQWHLQTMQQQLQSCWHGTTGTQDSKGPSRCSGSGICKGCKHMTSCTSKGKLKLLSL